MISRFLSGESSIDQQIAPNILSSNLGGNAFNYQQMLQEIYNLKSLQRNKKNLIHQSGALRRNEGEENISKQTFWEDIKN